ncbi:DNA glycosylase [Saccharata proteae CBS 121410]|uniref:DNA glycosylase n=1 Tax=Saccharata proteae CBS 121410 TaxID=1314787 RepID=A0A9P4M2K2_9PEZI|nr:DNA glycosylase [Saccharata proteae CBS 121410]
MSHSPAKKRRTPSKYAPPSKYAHLTPLKDILEPDLICVFVGTNPGIRTATAGHAYAHPSNMFWKLLHSSGCTDRRCAPEEDVDLPRLYTMGNTNIVERPSKDAAELSRAEMAAGTPILEAKFRKYKPEAVCIVGKGIWESIWRWRYGRNPTKDEFKYGWQDDKENMGKSESGEKEHDAHGSIWEGARVFVATSTSGLSASTRPAEKEAIWKPFGDWVRKRRAERAQSVII